MEKLSTVLENDKELEFIVIKSDPMFNDIIKAIDIIKDFIINNKLILYGGTAIDYALRLKGDKIYSDNMLLVPDLDFFSYDSVKHAYQLADMLYDAGFKSARAIAALHVETMRVDIGDNHFVADITYRPPNIFNMLPHIQYNGMNVIHPYYQRLDVHMSLLYLFENQPREVVFHRVTKDIKRFNKLNDSYPIITDVDVPSGAKIMTAHLPKHSIITGFAGYAIAVMEFNRLCKLVGIVAKYRGPSATFKYDNSIIHFDTIDNRLDLLSKDIEKTAKNVTSSQKIYYEPYINLFPAHVKFTVNNTNMYVYSTHNKLLSINSVNVDSIKIRVVNIQGLLLHFLAHHFVTTNFKAEFIIRYSALLDMINVLSPYIDNEDVRKSMFFPSLTTYGDNNINLSMEVALNRINYDLHNAILYKIPTNYYPERSNKVHPQFVYSQSKFFRISGKEIYIEKDGTDQI